jgi:hypothetical protein
MTNTGNLRDYYLNNKIDNLNGVSEIQRMGGLGEVNEEALKESLFRPQQYSPNAGSFFGNTSNRNLDSQINTDIDTLQIQGMNADNARAENQTILGRFGNALINNLVIAGTTAVSGTAGFLYGLVDFVVNADLSKLYNNPVNRAMLKAQEATNRGFGNYYTKDYQDSSIWKKLGTSIFWADVLKNLGYTEGMLLPSMGIAKTMSSAPELLTQLTASLTGAIGEGSIEALQAKQDKLNTERTILNDNYNKALLEATSYAERLALQEEYAKDLANMEEDSNQVGNTVLGLNVAILTASNMIEWGPLFSRGNKVSQINKKIKGKDVKVTDEGLSYNPKLEKLKEASNTLIRGYSEGQEEVLQDIAVRTANNYADYNSFNDSVFNDEKRDLADSFIQAVGSALSEAFKDPETATNFAMGFVTGFFGAPNFRKVKNSEGKTQSPITMEGGVFETYRNFKEIDRKNKIIEEINNEVINNPKTQEYYNNLIRNLDFQEKASMALDSNDEKAFRDWQFMQMLSNVMSLTEVGQTDYLSSIIQTAKDLTNDEIQQLIDDGNFREGNRNLTVQEAREVINKNANTLSNLIEEVTTNAIQLEASENGSKLSKESKQSILAAQSLFKNQIERINIINDELKDFYYKNVDQKNRKLTEEELDELINKNKSKERTDELFIKFLEDISGKVTTIELADLNKKIDDRKKLNDSAEMLQKEIEKAYKSPEHSNKKEEKKTQQNKEKVIKKKSNEKKDKLNNSPSYSEFKYSLTDLELEDAESARVLLDELVQEGNKYAVTYKKIQDIYKKAVGELSNMGLTQEQRSDAMSYLNNMMDNVDSYKEFISPNSYLNMDEFFNDVVTKSGDEDKDFKRHQEASILVQRALNKALERQADIITTKSLYTTPAEKTKEQQKKEEQTVGNSEVPQNPNPVDASKSESKQEIKQEEKKSEESPVTQSNEETEYGSKVTTQTKDEQQADLDELKNQTSPNYSSSIPTIENADLSENPVEVKSIPYKPASFYVLKYKDQGILVPITDTKKLEELRENWGTIGNWFQKTNAQGYIDKGGLKVGDKIVLGVDPTVKDYAGNQVIAIYKVDDDTKIPIGVYAENYKAPLTKKVKQNLLKEYSKFKRNNPDNNEVWYSDFTSSVSSLRGGYVSYTDNLTPVKALPEGTKLAVIRNFSVFIDGKENNDYILKDDIVSSNGLVYVAMPTVNGKYRLVRLNTNDFNSSISIESQLYKAIKSIMSRMLKVDTREDLTPLIKELSTHLYIPDFNFYLSPLKEDPNTKVLRLTKVEYARDFNGKLVPVKTTINGAEKLKEEVVAEFILGNNSEEYLNDVMNKLTNLNMRIKVDKSLLGNQNYVQSLLEANALSSKLDKYELTGAWFEYNPIDIDGTEIKPTQEDINIETQPQNKDKVLITLKESIIDVFEDGNYLDTDGIYHKASSYDEELRNKYLYQLQKQYGGTMNSSTTIDGKAIIGNKCINRMTGQWLTQEEYNEVTKQLEEINKKSKEQTPEQEINTTVDTAEKEQRALTEQEKKDLESKAKEENEELTSAQQSLIDLASDDIDDMLRTGVKPNKNGIYSSLLRGLEISRAYSVKTFLRAMKPYFPNNLKPIYHLLSLADKLGVRIQFDNTFSNNRLGSYNKNNNIISVYVNPTNVEFYETLVHELIHSITTKMFSTNNEYSNTIYNLYNSIRVELGDLTFSEFLAKLGESKFREELKHKGVPVKSLKDAFSNLFTDNFLEKADKIMSKYVKEELSDKEKEVLNRDADLAKEDFSFMGSGWKRKSTREEKIVARVCKGI